MGPACLPVCVSPHWHPHPPFATLTPTPSSFPTIRWTQKTLGSGNLRAAIKIPPGTSHKEEWFSVNTVSFYNQINLLYGCIKDFCTDETCPTMNAGPRYQYFWADGKTIIQPIQCTGPQYIEHLLAWIEAQLDDENTFPSSDVFPEQFLPTVKQIFKRMFRFYAHVYHNHLRELETIAVAPHFNTCFKHFILFVNEFDLVDQKELVPLMSIVDQILQQNPEEPAAGDN
ncbi:cytokinesis-related protein [Polychytrium aggregatum]|uniref:cytokinesis-related protein n=1 Tax=Polychytrium aggregatum TaxID=110093 RepID=UPI0022FF2976|nr:cytokinesis-related protein [Polychytrium aggregatum]KAI9209897.1 cytokinesis-related protein [Polychytrium aggregatum]